MEPAESGTWCQLLSDTTAADVEREDCFEAFAVLHLIDGAGPQTSLPGPSSNWVSDEAQYHLRSEAPISTMPGSPRSSKPPPHSTFHSLSILSGSWRRSGGARPSALYIEVHGNILVNTI